MHVAHEMHIICTQNAYFEHEGQTAMALAADKVRLSLQVSHELNQTLEDIAESTGTNRTDVIRQALALMKVAHSAKRAGRHLGIVDDARKLDTEIVGLI